MSLVAPSLRRASGKDLPELWGQSMTTLTTRQRHALPDSVFGPPKTRTYPMPELTHAHNAKALAAEELAADFVERT